MKLEQKVARLEAENRRLLDYIDRLEAKGP